MALVRIKSKIELEKLGYEVEDMYMCRTMPKKFTNRSVPLSFLNKIVEVKVEDRDNEFPWYAKSINYMFVEEQLDFNVTELAKILYEQS